jgi:hypothetical protein
MSLQNFLNSSRAYSKRVFGLPEKSVNQSGKPLLGDYNQAELIVKSAGGAGLLIFTAGYQVPGDVGRNLTLTIASGAGALAVSTNGFDITVTLASGGSTIAAVLAAVQTQLPAPSPLTGPTNPGYPFVAVAYFPGATTTTACPTLSKTNFTANQRVP